MSEASDNSEPQLAELQTAIEELQNKVERLEGRMEGMTQTLCTAMKLIRWIVPCLTAIRQDFDLQYNAESGRQRQIPRLPTNTDLDDADRGRPKDNDDGPEAKAYVKKYRLTSLGGQN